MIICQDCYDAAKLRDEGINQVRQVPFLDYCHACMTKKPCNEVFDLTKEEYWRIYWKNHPHGELDDMKVIDGLVRIKGRAIGSSGWIVKTFPTQLDAIKTAHDLGYDKDEYYIQLYKKRTVKGYNVSRVLNYVIRIKEGVYHE